MDDDPYRRRYVEHLRDLQSRHPPERALELIVGGEFHAIGVIERELLFRAGLGPSDFLIDVGCGSGRLVAALRERWRGRYLGIDVLPELIEHARKLAARPDWRFELTDGASIPQADGTADMVSFFSVLTHLPHQLGYRYLREARRVVRPGGKILFTFLEFTVPGHWPIFEALVGSSDPSSPWVQFLSRDAIEAWAPRLELRIETLERADQATIQLAEPLVMENGERLEGSAVLGQSVCVMSRAR